MLYELVLTSYSSCRVMTYSIWQQGFHFQSSESGNENAEFSTFWYASVQASPTFWEVCIASVRLVHSRLSRENCVIARVLLCRSEYRKNYQQTADTENAESRTGIPARDSSNTSSLLLQKHARADTPNLEQSQIGPLPNPRGRTFGSTKWVPGMEI